MTDPLYCKYGTFSFFTSTIVFNLKPSSHHLPRLALLFAGGVILVYLMNEIKMLLLLLFVVVVVVVVWGWGGEQFWLKSVSESWWD